MEQDEMSLPARAFQLALLLVAAGQGGRDARGTRESTAAGLPTRRHNALPTTPPRRCAFADCDRAPQPSRPRSLSARSRRQTAGQRNSLAACRQAARSSRPGLTPVHGACEGAQTVTSCVVGMPKCVAAKRRVLKANAEPRDRPGVCGGGGEGGGARGGERVPPPVGDVVAIGQLVVAARALHGCLEFVAQGAHAGRGEQRGRGGRQGGGGGGGLVARGEVLDVHGAARRGGQAERAKEGRSHVARRSGRGEGVAQAGRDSF